MASIVTIGRTRQIRFRSNEGEQITLRLGKMSDRDAQHVLGHVDELVAAVRVGRAPSASTTAFLDGIHDVLHDRLHRAGLCAPREAAAPTLQEFTDHYLGQRKDVKVGTMIVFRQAQRHLLRFMGSDCKVDAVTPGDADAFRAHLLSEKRSKATIAKWCQYARHFFEVAKRRRLIHENPFAHIKGSVRGNASRRVFVSAEDIAKVLDACPDHEWRLMVALARYGGLRCPSEVLALTWADVQWDRGVFIVRSSKTEHHDGEGVRIVPIFSELRPYLQDAFDHAAEGSEHCIMRYRAPSVNLRTQLQRIVIRAGVKPWPKAWQNLRATRATELCDRFPGHVAAGWLGHSEKVADEFYRTTTDLHYLAATTQATVAMLPMVGAVDTSAANVAQKSATKATTKATTNATTRGTASNCGEETTPPQTHVFAGFTQAFAAGCNFSQDRVVGAGGFEPPKA